MAREAEVVKLKKVFANIPKEKIFDEIRLQTPYLKKMGRTDSFALNKDFLLIKGAFCYSVGEDDAGEEYPYFGVLLKNEGKLLVETFEELLQVFLVNRKYFFAAYWQDPEGGKRGFRIFSVEGKSLENVFSDYSGAT